MNMQSHRPGDLRSDDIRLVLCPDCGGALEQAGQAAGERGGGGDLRCVRCAARWPLDRGFLRLYREEQVKGTDRLMRALYNAVPSLHDSANHYLLPLLQLGGSERAMRDAIMTRIDVGSLAPRSDGSPARILEIGVGSGANIPLIAQGLPRALRPSASSRAAVEVWGLDLSEGMLRQCARSLQRRERGLSGVDVRLLMADAHALPFPDHTFDRVFHVGALGSFRDPGKALREMARVARPGTPIVVVDEQLDRNQRANLYQRATFRLLTFYDADPHCPTELLPEGASGVIEEQISRFYYCLTFRMPDLSTSP